MTRPVVNFKTRSIARLVALATPLVVTAFALGQSGNNLGPRTPKLETAASPVVGYAIMAVLTGIVLAISLYPSKRAHTDL